MNENTDDLRAALRSADPAASLSPLSPARFTELKDAIMTDTITPDATPASAPRKRASTRARVAWVVAGGLAAVGVGALAIPAIIGAGAPGPVTVLSAPVVDPMATSLKCAEVTPEALQQATIAFEATAVSVAENGTVTLDVADVFKGEITDTVEVTNGNPEISDGGGVMYDQGTTYLLTSDGTDVWSCGLSDVKTPELQKLYDAAFN